MRHRAVASKTAAAGGGGISPDDLPDLVLWMDAADTATITASSNDVSQWVSKDAGAKTFTQGNAGSRPRSGVTSQNGLNTVEFPDLTSLLNRISTDLDYTSGNFMIYGVVKVVGNGDGNDVWISTSDEPFQIRGWYVSGYGGTVLNRSGSASIAGGTLGPGAGWKVLAITVDGTTPRMAARINDVEDAVVATSNITHVASAGPQCIGGYDSGGSSPANFIGEIAEILVYSGVHSSGDRGDVTDYLNTKWDVY